eukprot:TRINITY_DN17933_c0_g1_i1.p2 TRINITY_DN17933_c0_g1~~TRINITY_DN17933_c0_g1_i1.p2  ORF type:complete len:100 (+),score=26.02 TRINITY_DN17933_c0_g1_i1:99-398(+)
MPANILIEPMNTIWRSTVIKEKILKAEKLLLNPELTQTIEAQLAGTWRPEGSARIGVQDPALSDGFRYPISGYGGHAPMWDRDAPRRKASSLALALQPL